VKIGAPATPAVANVHRFLFEFGVCMGQTVRQARPVMWPALGWLHNISINDKKNQNVPWKNWKKGL